MPPARIATTRGIPHMATRRFAGPLGGTTAGPGTGTSGSPPVPGAGALLEKDCIFFLPAQWAPLQLWCCFNGEDDVRVPKVIARRPKVHFFQTLGTDIGAEAAHRLLGNATGATGWCQGFDPDAQIQSLLHASHSFLGSCRNS